MCPCDWAYLKQTWFDQHDVEPEDSSVACGHPKDRTPQDLLSMHVSGWAAQGFGSFGTDVVPVLLDLAS